VPGLRREELAQLAGVSAGYYTRLEQGQAETASEQVLDALARVLQHPTVGAASVAYQVWLQPDSPDHRLEIYTPNDSSSADALRILAHQSRRDREADTVRQH
jgi:transcriptional regulator with XRE-family HTH domain